MRAIGQMTTAAFLAAAVLGGFGSAQAQGPEGPLAPPDAPTAAAPKHPAAKRAKIKTVARRSEVPVSAKLPATPLAESPPVATTRVSAAKVSAAKVPTDPVSFGMKWNGANESGRETRFENLNGGASGTGGEVGVKLHF